jgi:ATP-binding protein involved in chromosome partitioning
MVEQSGTAVPDESPLAGIRHIVAVASAKGGVGKSTISVNLALGLARAGHRVGLLDGDIYGPSLPLLMDVHDEPALAPNGSILPVEKDGLALMSIGLVARDDMPVIWRGPLLAQALQQFLSQVAWGDLDYLIIDLPPGTGDVALTLCQTVELSGAVVVTTPQDVSLQDVERGIAMFDKVDVDVLGVVENMSYFICPHCQERHQIFSHGGGRAAAERLELEFLGEVPLDPQIRAAGDGGRPVVLAAPDSEQGRVMLALTERIVAALERQEQDR